MCILGKMLWCLMSCDIVVYHNGDVVYDGYYLDVPDDLKHLVVVKLFAKATDKMDVYVADGCVI